MYAERIITISFFFTTSLRPEMHFQRLYVVLFVRRLSPWQNSRTKETVVMCIMAEGKGK
jgi:hypothetical protein